MSKFRGNKHEPDFESSTERRLCINILNEMERSHLSDLLGEKSAGKTEIVLSTPEEITYRLKIAFPHIYIGREHDVEIGQRMKLIFGSQLEELKKTYEDGYDEDLLAVLRDEALVFQALFPEIYKTCDTETLANVLVEELNDLKKVEFMGFFIPHAVAVRILFPARMGEILPTEREKIKVFREMKKYEQELLRHMNTDALLELYAAARILFPDREAEMMAPMNVLQEVKRELDRMKPPEDTDTIPLVLITSLAETAQNLRIIASKSVEITPAGLVLTQ